METNQQSLFGEPITIGRSVDHTKIRQAAIERAQRNQSEQFLIEFRNFVLRYADSHDEFSTEEIRREYSKTNLPKPISLKSGKLEWRAAGGVIQALSNSRQIVFVRTGISPTRRSDIKFFRKA